MLDTGAVLMEIPDVARRGYLKSRWCAIGGKGAAFGRPLFGDSEAFSTECHAPTIVLFSVKLISLNLMVNLCDSETVISTDYGSLGDGATP